MKLHWKQRLRVGTAQLFQKKRTKKTYEKMALAEFPGSKRYLSKERPAGSIVVLHGSDGGPTSFDGVEPLLQCFLDAGLSVVTFSYFRSPRQSQRLYRIELSSVLQMIEWLKLDVSKDRNVGLLGFSRGAEMAVLLGSLVQTTDTIAAIGAYAPSDTVVASYDPNLDDMVHEVDSNGSETIYRYGPAWLWHGKEIYGDQMSIQNVSPAELFAGLDESAAYEKWRSLWVRGPRIAVERYQGPLFVTHGDQDEIWEVDRARRLVSSRSQQSSVETIYREFAGEGHRFSPEAYAQVLRELTDFFVRHL